MDSSPTEESEVHPEWAGEGADSASGAASNLSRILVTAPEMASRGSRKVSASALIEAATSCRAAVDGWTILDLKS